MGIWVNMADVAGQAFMAKYLVSGSNREYYWIAEVGNVKLQLYDMSAGVSSVRAATLDISTDIWIFLVVTYDGRGGADAADGIALYKDGAIVTSTATNNASYANMENKASVMELGRYNTGTYNFDGKMAGGPLGPFFTRGELIADEVAHLYELGRGLLDIP